jgi:hypothetical protein
MALKKYAELGHVHRTQPCEEYPGRYIIYKKGDEVNGCSVAVGESAARELLA